MFKMGQRCLSAVTESHLRFTFRLRLLLRDYENALLYVLCPFAQHN